MSLEALKARKSNRSNTSIEKELEDNKRKILEYSQNYPNPTGPVEDRESVVKLDCRDIDKNPFQNRRRILPEKVKELAQSIRNNGQEQPIAVRRVGDRYQIIFGEHRWRACNELDNKTVDAVIREASDLDMIYSCYVENSNRSAIFDYERSISIRDLLDKNENRDTIRVRLGISEQDYYKIIKFQDLPKSVRDFLDENPAALQRNDAQDLVKIYKDLGSDIPDDFEDTLFKLMNDYLSKKLKNRGDIVKKLRDLYITKRTRNRPKQLQEKVLYSGKQKVGAIVIAPSEVRINIDKTEFPEDLVERFIQTVNIFFNKINEEEVSGDAQHGPGEEKEAT